MFNYFNFDDFNLFFDDRKLIEEIEKDETTTKADSFLLNQIFVLSKEINNLSLNINACKELSSYSALKLLELIFNISQHQKKLTINKSLEIYKGEYILTKFDYHPVLINKIKKLQSAKFLAEEKRWFFHISEWRELQQIFKETNFAIEQLYLEWKVKNSKNKLIITEKSCQLLGSNLPLDIISLENSFEDVTAKHKPSFKKGNWDGRIKLFDINTRFFPIGLLNKIKNILNFYNINYEIIDLRTFPEKKFNFQENVTLRDYQEYVVNKAIDSKSGILQLATGAGKTKIACSLTSRLGLKTIFFVHTHFLLNQAKKEFEKVLGIKIGQIGDGIIDIQEVTVAMVQTTMKALGEEYIPSIDDEINEEDLTDVTGKEEIIKELLSNANVIFFDECQFVAAESFYTIANSCSSFYKYGLSATPYRSDKKDPMIIAALGDVVAKVSASYLIKRGFLTQPKIHFIKNTTNCPVKRKYHLVYKEDVVENLNRNLSIVNATKRLISKNRSVLILIQQINHGEILQKLLLQHGIEAEFVSGINDNKKRELEVEKLKNKQSLCLIASTIADEGLDIPSLDAVILAGAGKSPSKELQRVGRALRLFKEDNILFETEQMIKNNPSTSFGIVCSNEYKSKLTNILSIYHNFNFVENQNNNCDKYIYIDYYQPIQNTFYNTNLLYVDNEPEINTGLIFVKTKKDLEFLRKYYKKKNVSTIIINSINEFSLNKINLYKIEDLKEDTILFKDLISDIFLYNIEEDNQILQKDVFIFNPKTESFIVDFADNSQYLSNHSYERYLMLKSEPEFIITGENNFQF